MKTKTYNSIYKILLAIATLLISIWYVFGQAQDTSEWIKGKYGKHCYVVGEQHENINMDTALYFNSLTDCQNHE
jgi:hypothetical protein